MASTTALWFAIEQAFREMDEVCVEARAAQLVARRARDEGARLRALTQGRAPVEEAPDLPPAESLRYVRASELAKDLAFRDAHPEGADLVELRAKLRKRLGWLKARLSEALPEHDVYYAMFPLVVYCDELVRSATRGETSRWEPLQSELYEVDNGGEVFFSILEDRLRQEETLPLVFEVFYFCLSDGFAGMYQGDAKKIDEYRTRLAERIPKKPVDAVDDGHSAPVELVAFPWRYYAAAAGVVLATYSVLSWAASTS